MVAGSPHEEGEEQYEEVEGEFEDDEEEYVESEEYEDDEEEEEEEDGEVEEGAWAGSNAGSLAEQAQRAPCYVLLLICGLHTFAIYS